MNTEMRRNALVLGTIAIAGAACAGGERPGAGDTGTPARAPGAAAGPGAGGMEGMPGMPGMGGMEGGGMMARMQAHMDSMGGVASGRDLQRMLPMHRQMTANMLSTMSREMRDMNMTGDAAWTALMDSVRQDLRDLPEMTPDQLGSSMPGHRERIMRLMAMHREMMASMQM